MIRDELGIDIYPSTELSKQGVGKLLVSATVDGVAFISKRGRPAAMLMPMSVEGLQRAFEKFREMIEISSKLDKEEFSELYEVAIKHLNKFK